MHSNELYNKIINLRKRRIVLKNQIKELKLKNCEIPKELSDNYNRIRNDIIQLTIINEGHFGK